MGHADVRTYTGLSDNTTRRWIRMHTILTQFPSMVKLRSYNVRK